MSLKLKYYAPVTNLQYITITENGTYYPSSGYNGFNKISVTVPTRCAHLNFEDNFLYYEYEFLPIQTKTGGSNQNAHLDFIGDFPYYNYEFLPIQTECKMEALDDN